MSAVLEDVRAGYKPRLVFTGAPEICRFLHSPRFVRSLIGPVGSGKSTACCAELMRIASEQEVYPGDNYKRSRFAIVRNTSPELKTTTIKTWLQLFPEEHCGPMRYSAPITHHIVRHPEGNSPGLDAEFIFLALDQESDVKKLKSLELTAAWVNEASEVPRAIIDMLRRRVRRFPRRIGRWRAVHPCVILDTNAPDEDHWLCKFDRHERPANWSFFHQAPAVFEVELLPGGREVRVLDPEASGRVYPVEMAIAGAGRWWVVNDQAENLDNLDPAYYGEQIAGSTLAEIRRMLQARYVYVQSGRPVLEEYIDEAHAVADLTVLKDRPLMIGIDIGGGTLEPAAIIGQQGMLGNWLLHRELVFEGTGVKRFGEFLKKTIVQDFASHGMEGVEIVYADPAGANRDEIYETVIFDHMREMGFPVQPAPSNDIALRIDAWRAPIGRFIEGKPGLMINKDGCPLLRKGLAGAWHYRRMQIAGEERYQDKPIKNKYSHPCDAGGYLLMGGGEYMATKSGSSKPGMDPARDWGQSGAAEFDIEFDL